MKIKYKTTTRSCPICGELLYYTNELEYMLLLMMTLPISIPLLIAYRFLNAFVFDTVVPRVKPPSFFKCKCCGKELTISGFYLKSELTGEDLLAYKFRWLFRMCYVLGAIFLWMFIVVIFILTSDDINISELVWTSSIGILCILIIYVVSRVFDKKKSNL